MPSLKSQLPLQYWVQVIIKCFWVFECESWVFVRVLNYGGSSRWLVLVVCWPIYETMQAEPFSFHSFKKVFWKKNLQLSLFSKRAAWYIFYNNFPAGAAEKLGNRKQLALLHFIHRWLMEKQSNDYTVLCSAPVPKTHISPKMVLLCSDHSVTVILLSCVFSWIAQIVWGIFVEGNFDLKTDGNMWGFRSEPKRQIGLIFCAPDTSFFFLSSK